MRTIHAVIAALLLLPSASLSAQMRGTLEGAPAQPRFTQAVNDPRAVTPRTVRIDCGPEIKCGEVRLVTESEPEVAWAAVVADGGVRFTEPAGAPAGSIAVRYGTFRVILDPAGPPADRVVGDGGGAGTGFCPAGSDEMQDLMDSLRAIHHPRSLVMFVDSLGHVLRPAPRAIDEGEPIHLYAIRGPDRDPTLSIRRVSAFREMETYPIIGEDATVAERNAAAPCNVHQYALLENFRGGEAGQISINRAETKAGGARDTTRLGLVEIAVRRTYRGALSLGIARSSLEDPEFTAVGTDSTVVSRSGGARLLYTLFFTPFYSRRAAEDRTRPFYEYVTPQVGVVVDDVRSNILYGLNAEIPWLGLYAGLGGHTGKVTRIPSDGPRVNTNLRGTGRGVETEEVWSTRLYLSLSLDLRAASTFLSRITK